ncbi:glutaredoxin 3 [Pseudomonas sp. S2_B03]
MKNVTMYATSACPFCRNAKALLAGKNIKAKEINVEADSERMREMVVKSGRRSVPQIFIGEQHIGGFDDMIALDRNGSLDALLGK